PQDPDRGQLHDHHDCGEGNDENPVHRECGSREVVVRRREALLLVATADERAEHAHAGDLLAQHLVDAVDLHLRRAEGRHALPQHEGDDQPEHGDDDEEYRRQGDVLAQGHDHAAHGGDRREDQHREGDLQKDLDLLHVVGVAGYERRGAESVDLTRREGLDAAEDQGAQVTTHAHGREGGVVDADHSDDPEYHGHTQHHRAGLPDVGHVALGDAVVDDVGVQVRQVEAGDRLDQHHDADNRDLLPVRAELASEQLYQHGAV